MSRFSKYISYFTGVAVDILRSSENVFVERLVVVARDLTTLDARPDFEVDFESDFSMFVHEINVPVDAGLFDKSLYEPEKLVNPESLVKSLTFVGRDEAVIKLAPFVN